MCECLFLICLPCTVSIIFEFGATASTARDHFGQGGGVSFVFYFYVFKVWGTG